LKNYYKQTWIVPLLNALTQTLAKTHIVLASIEKVIPTMEDCSVFLRVLARSATGQSMSAYNSFSIGPKRLQDADGPEQYHVILLDNGRSQLLGGEFQDMLRCIRCGACMNHCPVYHAIGGHAYGSVYPGPMGSVLTPIFDGLKKARHLPYASTFCGRCEAVCPVRIPLPRMLRAHRRLDFENRLTPPKQRLFLYMWTQCAKHPAFYRALNRIVARLLKSLARHGIIKNLPLTKSWSAHRDLPAPAGYSFHEWWQNRDQNHD
ncbi:MAG: 4Fe-4S dicluster domain-containing protein, partial [Pseudomonadota bacterium]